MNFLDFINSFDKNILFKESKHKIETKNIHIDQSNQNFSKETFDSFQKFIDQNKLISQKIIIQVGGVGFHGYMLLTIGSMHCNVAYFSSSSAENREKFVSRHDSVCGLKTRNEANY